MYLRIYKELSCEIIRLKDLHYLKIVDWFGS